jgi:NTE family protein
VPARLESLRRPLYVCALDLASGEEIVLTSGDLRQVLTASSAVAGFFPPVVIDGRTLVDAGLADNLPVDTAIERCHRPIVAVNLSCEVDERVDFGSGIEFLLRSEELSSRFNTRQRALRADLQIQPRLGGRYWLDFSKPATIVTAGEEAARAALPAIRSLLPSAPTASAPCRAD